MLPKEIDKIFEEYYDEDLSLVITKADFSTNDFEIHFTLQTDDINDKGAIVQHWIITAIEHREENLSFDFAENITIKTDHPLLWKYHDIQCQLYYSGKCNDIPKLFYELFVTHKQIFGNYKCFNLSFGEETNYFKAFQYTNGLLTEGSKNLMLKYADCLKKNGLDYSIIGERPAKYWNGEQYVIESKDLKVLFFGKGYIIAKDFVFNQQKNSS